MKTLKSKILLGCLTIVTIFNLVLNTTQAEKILDINIEAYASSSEGGNIYIGQKCVKKGTLKGDGALKLDCSDRCAGYHLYLINNKTEWDVCR